MTHAENSWSLALLLVALTAHAAKADVFTYRDRAGKRVTVEARLVASAQRQHVLELPSGEYRVVPQAVVTKRVQKDPPTPLTADEVLEQLKVRFGGERGTFRGRAEGHFVVGLVLNAPLKKTSESKVTNCLKKAIRFQKSVERRFLTFTKKMKIKTESPTHPLVLLIFETDADFEKYHKETTSGAGLSSSRVAGFYSALTNWLVIRMTECLTFETPLHEAIHQQVFNQHVLQRLAPTPAWFNEGIATGFEGNSDRISRTPGRVSVRYARQINRARSVSWSDLVADDRAFGGDIFAGQAYTQSWAMHWLLVTKYKKQYAEYVELIGKETPLAELNSAKRKRTVEQIFGKSVSELQAQLPVALSTAIKQQRLPPPKEDREGELTLQSNLADVALVGLTNRRGEFVTEGTLRNISLIRPMTFHVVALTNAGTYAEWVLPNVGINKQVKLNAQAARLRAIGASGGPARSFRLMVNSTAPESEEAKRWAAGDTPKPRIR